MIILVKSQLLRVIFLEVKTLQKKGGKDFFGILIFVSCPSPPLEAEKLDD